jgi:hypothetical protein
VNVIAKLASVDFWASLAAGIAVLGVVFRPTSRAVRRS